MNKLLKFMAIALLYIIALPTASGQTRTFRNVSAQRIANSPLSPLRSHFENVRSLRPFRTTTPHYRIKPVYHQQKSDGRTVTINGIVYDGYEYTASSFDVSSPVTFNTLSYSDDFESSGCAVYANGKMYVNSLRTGLLETTTRQRVFDCSDWSLIEKRDLSCTVSATAMTYDESTNTIFGQFYNEDMSEVEWGYFDPHSGRTTGVRIMDERLYALAAAADGTIYAINENGLLETLDPQTGIVKDKIGNTGIVPKFIQSATIDTKSGKMYWCAMESDGFTALYDVNLTTGEATKIADFEGGEEIVGAYIVEKAENAAPAEVSSLSLDFEGNSLSGKVKFHTPALTTDGNKLTGSLTVKIMINGEVKTIESQPNQDCSVDISVPEAGWYCVKVFVANDAGESLKSIAEQWIGVDKPQAPSNIKLVNRNGTAYVTWTAPTEGQNGGYIDQSRLTYTVMRMPGGAIVAENYTKTEFSELIDDNDVNNVSYYITPFYEGQRGETAYSNSVAFGSAYTVPATVDLWNITDFGLCTIEDANSDGNTWQWLGGAKYNGSDECSADDWLITPAFLLEKGRFYNLEYSVSASNGYMFPERYDIMMGNGNESSAMTTEVVKDETIEYIYVNDKYVEKSVRMKVNETGNYYFGIHAKSDAGNHTLMFSTIGVSNGPVYSAPDSVADLQAVAADKGELRATLSFTVPTKNVVGETLQAIGKIEISHNGKLIATFDGKQPGEKLTYTDTEALQGENTYSVVCYDADGNAGDGATTSVYVGVDRPSAPCDFKLNYTEGNVHLSWKAPADGLHGKYINPADLKYIITEGLYDEIVASDITATSYDIAASVEKGKQEIFGYSLYAQNVAGFSPAATSNYIMVGDAYQLPFNEQFTNGIMTYNMWVADDASGESLWDMDTSNGHVTTGCPVFSGGYGDYHQLSTGMIDLTDALDPVLSFWARSTSSKDKLQVNVSTDFNEPYNQLAEVDFSTITPGEWHKVVLPLTQYKGKSNILIGFKAFANDTYSSIWFDDVIVRDQKSHDLAVISITSDLDKVELGKTSANISLGVANIGKEDVMAADYTAKLFCNGNLVATADGKDITSDEEASFTLKYVPQSTDKANNQLYAVVDYAADENSTDNTSDTINVNVVKPQMPTVDDLKLDATGESCTLSWSQPDLSVTAARIVTDDFESYEAFTLDEIGEWTLHDVDGYNVCNIQGTSYPNMYKPMAFQVFNPSLVSTTTGGLSSIFDPHNGNQYLVDFACEDGANDDWLVSPELSGNAQTISFYARSVTNQYGLEQFEVYASDTGTETTDMKLVMDETKASVKWTKYTVDIPAGTKHFAIRCVSDMRFAFMIDDVTYECAPKPLEVEFLGYNVYRDGKKINDQPLSSATFTDDNTAKNAAYYVTVVYNLGESEPSNTVINSTTDINNISEESVSDGPVYTTGGIRIIKPTNKGLFIKNGKKYVKK